MCFVLVLQVFKWWFLCCRSMLSPDWFFLPSSSGIHLMQSTQSRTHFEIMSPPPSTKQQEKLSHVSPQQSHAKGSSFLFTAHAYSTLKFWSTILPMACKNTQHHEMLLHTRVTRWVTRARAVALISWPFCCYTGSVRAAAAAACEVCEHKGGGRGGGWFGKYVLWEQPPWERFRRLIPWMLWELLWEHLPGQQGTSLGTFLATSKKTTCKGTFQKSCFVKGWIAFLRSGNGFSSCKRSF